MLAIPEIATEAPHTTPHPATQSFTPPSGESCPERIARHLETLREITELARGLARQLAAELSAARPQPPEEEKPGRRGPDLRLMFDRMVRLIRDMIKLENIIGGWSNDIAETPPPLRETTSRTAEPAAAQIRLSRHERRSLEKRLRLARGAQHAFA